MSTPLPLTLTLTSYPPSLLTLQPPSIALLYLTSLPASLNPKSTIITLILTLTALIHTFSITLITTTILRHIPTHLTLTHILTPHLYPHSPHSHPHPLSPSSPLLSLSPTPIPSLSPPLPSPVHPYLTMKKINLMQHIVLPKKDQASGVRRG